MWYVHSGMHKLQDGQHRFVPSEVGCHSNVDVAMCVGSEMTTDIVIDHARNNSQSYRVVPSKTAGC